MNTCMYIFIIYNSFTSSATSCELLGGRLHRPGEADAVAVRALVARGGHLQELRRPLGHQRGGPRVAREAARGQQHVPQLLSTTGARGERLEKLSELEKSTKLRSYRGLRGLRHLETGVFEGVHTAKRWSLAAPPA